MRLLLDTHTLAWWSEDSSALSPAGRAAILDSGNEVFFSPVSVDEIALEHRLGK